MVKKIKFKISKDGSIDLEVLGAKGNECEELTSSFEKELGVVIHKEQKEEYYQSNTEQLEEENEEKEYSYN